MGRKEQTTAWAIQWKRGDMVGFISYYSTIFTHPVPNHMQGHLFVAFGTRKEARECVKELKINQPMVNDSMYQLGKYEVVKVNLTIEVIDRVKSSLDIDPITFRNDLGNTV
jgi:hypothetical protein